MTAVIILGLVTSILLIFRDPRPGDEELGADLADAVFHIDDDD